MRTLWAGKAVAYGILTMAKYTAFVTRRVPNPYASWTDPRTGWKYKLLKSWQKDNKQEYARWHMLVDGYGLDMGDTYVHEMIAGLRMATDLVFDTSVWPDKEAFMAWAEGGQKKDA